MRISRFVFLLVLFTFAKSAMAQQATASAPQATALLQRALIALSGGHPLTDVTLSGTARRIAGSDDEFGTAIIKARALTGWRIDLTLPSGVRTELRNTSGAELSGSWSGPDGVLHPESSHNLFIDPAWFPAFTFASLLSAPNVLVTLVGQETRNGHSVIHLTASQQFTTTSDPGASLMRHLGQNEIFLDASTLLPVTIAFSSHPDNNSLLDIPIEIDFSDYRTANGAQIPFHVQKLINNGLSLDLQFESVAINSGLSQAEFTVGAAL